MQAFKVAPTPAALSATVYMSGHLEMQPAAACNTRAFSCIDTPQDGHSASTLKAAGMPHFTSIAL